MGQWFSILCGVYQGGVLSPLGLDRYHVGTRYPISNTIGRSYTDTGNDVPHSLGQTYVTYVAHTVRTFQNIMLLTLCFEMCATNYKLETIGVPATVLTAETGE